MCPRSDGEPAGDRKTCTDPLVIAWTPRSERIRVLLPLPLGPSRPMSSPGAAENEMDFNISWCWRLTQRLTTSNVGCTDASIRYGRYHGSEFVEVSRKRPRAPVTHVPSNFWSGAKRCSRIKLWGARRD